MKSHSILILAIIASLASAAEAKYSGGSGEPGNPYQLATANDLLDLAGTTTDYGKCFILTADIDLEGQVFTTAIITASTGYGFNGTAFTGTFDGNGHKITHFTINGGSNYYLGLFGYIGSGGSVKNLGLENCTVSGSFGFLYVGSLVGANYGSISNCYSTGAISGFEYVGGLVGANPSGSISICYSTGMVSGGYDSGGLVGVNSGTISHCHSTGAFSGVAYIGSLVGDNSSGTINHCYSTGAISGYQNVGGLVGYNPGGSISKCYSTGTVNGTYCAGGLVGYNTGGSISNCYSTGSVSGSSYVGGLVGQKVPGGDAVNSFWDTETSGWTTSADGIGKTTAQMKTKSTFTDAGWDFLTIWNIVDGQTYPFIDSVGDGIPDWWRAQYFGGDGTTTNNQSCATCDADGTGQNNRFKYTAGLDPTNPASIFVLRIENVGGQPNQKNLIFSPWVAGRTYTPQFRIDLTAGGWAVLAGIGGPTTNDNQVTVTDLNATQPQKFYRIQISYP